MSSKFNQDTLKNYKLFFFWEVFIQKQRTVVSTVFNIMLTLVNHIILIKKYENYTSLFCKYYLHSKISRSFRLFYSIPKDFDGFPSLPPLPNTHDNNGEPSREPTPISLASSLEQIQIRSPCLEQIQSRTPSLEYIQSRVPSLEQIQSRSSSFEQLRSTSFNPSPIPVCCRTPTNSTGKLSTKQQRPKKVSFRLDQLPQRRPQTT